MKRSFTPDRVNPDGSTTIVLKRGCNGCGQLIGDVEDRDADEHGNLTDVRAECDFCRPVVEFERLGCATWFLTRWNISRVDDEIDRLGVYAKGYWQDVDGKLMVVGLRIGTGEDRVVARFGDWIIHHPGVGWTVHKAVAS